MLTKYLSDGVISREREHKGEASLEEWDRGIGRRSGV